jgi:hypothetical protein
MIKKQIIFNDDNGIHGLSPLVNHLMGFNFLNVNFDMMNYSSYSSSSFKSLMIYMGERRLKSGKLDETYSSSSCKSLMIHMDERMLKSAKLDERKYG